MSKDPKKNSTAQKLPGTLDHVMDVIRHIESTDKSGVRPLSSTEEQKNKTGVFASSAYGYYQVLAGTLDDINREIVSEGGKPLTLNSREEQHEAGRRLVLMYDRHLKNNMGIKNPTLEDYYGCHFKGMEGYKQIRNADRKSSMSGYASVDERSANPELLNGTVDSFYKSITKKINAAEAAIKKESPERKASLKKEKAGYDEGRITPVDKRAGSYKGDGKESWHQNKFAPNGTKLGEHGMDYIIDKQDGKAKIIKAKGTSPQDVVGDYKFEEYDYSKNLYNPELDGEIGRHSGAGTESFSLPDAGQNYKGQKGNKAQLMDAMPIDSGKYEDMNYNKASLEKIAPLAAALYANPDNPYSATGNQAHQKINVNGKILALDALTPAVDPTVTQAQDMLSTFTELPSDNQQQHFKLGGDMKLPQQDTEQNTGLVSFNEGGTHEENPLGGIPQNTNPDGTTNKVEEGETKHNNYVFSNSLRIMPAEADRLMLPEEIEGMTYAEASKFLNQALVENENDPIVKKTVNKQLDNLKVGNEKARLEKEASNVREQELLEKQRIAQEEEALSRNNEGGPEVISSTGDSSVEPSYEQVPDDFSLDNAQVPQEPVDESMLAQNPDLMPQDFKLGGKLYNAGGMLGNYQVKDYSQRSSAIDDFNFGNESTVDTVDTVESVPEEGFTLDDKALGSAMGKVGTVAKGGVQMANMFNTKDAVNRGEKINKGKMALQGAAAGATMGSVAGPWGTAIGAVVGAGAGYISGATASKKSEARRKELDNLDYLNDVSDFRTVSGMKETNINEFNNGGDLLDFSLNDNTLQGNPLYLQGGKSNLFDTSDNLSFNRNRITDYTGDSPIENNDSDSPFKFDFDLKRGGSPLRYAPAFAAYDEMKRMGDTQFRDSYVSSGQRYTPTYANENDILSKIQLAGNNVNRAIIANANGSASAARAGLIANGSSIANSINDAYNKLLEFNASQNAHATAVDNEILTRKDTVANAEEVANMNNKQVEYKLRRNERNNFANILANVGKEQDMNTQTINTTGYDRFGRKVK